MILGTTNIDVNTIAGLVNDTTFNIGTICKSDSINKWSRIRPGYWSISNLQLVFNKPQGNGYTDPRGTDSEIASNQQLFKLGDFRGYNSSALPVRLAGPSESDYLLNSTDPTSGITINYTVNIGEVDWFLEETLYRGKNTVSGYNQIVAATLVDGSYITKGYCDYSSLTTYDREKLATMSVGIDVPATSGYTVDNTIYFGLGTANKLYVPFPNCVAIVHATRASKPVYNIYMKNDATNVGIPLFSNLQGVSGSDDRIYRIDIMPTSGTLEEGQTSLSFTSTDTIITTYPSYNQWRVIQTHWTVGGTVECRNSSGTLVSSSTFSQTWAMAGSGKYTVTIPLPVSSVDGYTYNIIIDSIGTTAVTAV